jgi:hypothetical protein
MELELFLKLLKKLPQLFGKATYVQQASILDIFISNIVITPEKNVIINVKKDLQPLFDGYVNPDVFFLNHGREGLEIRKDILSFGRLGEHYVEDGNYTVLAKYGVF